jgi:hypothetical protein
MMRRALTITCVAVVLLGSPLAITDAHAQSRGELAAARDLFQTGLEAAREGRWPEAREAFEASIAIAPRPNTWLNLAGAQAQTGRLVAAAASYRTFLELAQGGREARYREQAEQALRDVEARIAHLTIATAGVLPGDEVRLDDESIEDAALTAPLAVDPGRRVVTVVREDEEVARQTIALGEGESRTVALEVAQSRPREEPPVLAPAAAFDVSEPEADEGSDDTWIWVGVGVGAAVVIGVGIAVAVVVTSGGNEPLYSGNLGDGMIRY